MDMSEQKKMDTSKLKKFAQFARRSLIEQVSSKISLVLKEESSVRRELPKVVAKLEAELNSKGKEQLIEQVAYIWFNRFCALRFMDVNTYNRIGVLSPAEGQFQPEILAEAKAGHIDESVVNEAARANIFGLLDGSIKSRDSQSEAYRLLIVAVCNDYHRIMPYLFERIEDYTELLMPDDLLSGNSILAYTREAMTPEACESVECIGWLYQFYISEKKDKVFEGLKNNKKITPENIPAATQLFTPHWIVRYLVENSLGRLWILNNPNSKVIDLMDYYIKPVDQENDFLKINTPEELKVCDPACGSGHMLTYSYDLLYAIYLDAGYDPADIPELILTKNLYGIEIDERAAELAAFALSMKALKGNPNDDSNNRRRFFRNPIKPNICRLENVTFKEDELDEYIAFVGRDLFTQDLRATLKEFEEANNFGSLIQPTLKNAEDILATLEAKDVSGQLFLTEIHKRVLQVIKQADYLRSNYEVVVTNPPYAGSRGLNKRLAAWLNDKYKNSKTDLFSAFIEQGMNMCRPSGYVSMVTMESWMFLSSYYNFRSWLLSVGTINNLLHMPYLGKGGTSMGISFGTSAFVCEKRPDAKKVGQYCSVRYFETDDNGVPNEFPPQNERRSQASTADFKKIPGSPIAYWISERVIKSFEEGTRLDEVAPTRKGMVTARNDVYVRDWYEVSLSKSGLDRCANREEARSSNKKWFSYLKGGGFRKWYGNKFDVVNWENDGQLLQSTKHPSEDRVWATNFNLDYIFKSNVNWGAVTSAEFSARMSNGGELFDAGGSACFPQDVSAEVIVALLNSKITGVLLKALNPTLNFQAGNIASIPLSKKMDQDSIELNTASCVELAKKDWNSYETSWDFDKLPLLNPNWKKQNLKLSYTAIRAHWNCVVREMKLFEEENNRILIDSYGLQNELSPQVLDKDITLICNPVHRYGMNVSGSDRENRLRSDTVTEFISYAVGCIFGRYSLEIGGLVLADQGVSLEDYLRQVPLPAFTPDDDNVIPMIDFEGDWFEDDISERFKQFLKVTFGEENFSDNLAFVEEAIGKEIKKYFAKDFYADHVKRYKKRPIYWLFSSPKGTFNALIYMHRYRPDTVSVVLNDYLREFRTKLQARKESYEQIEISVSASQKDKTQAIKAIDKINKVLDEVNDYERDILYPLAGQNIEIDLDDGVKHNYPLFGKALKKIAGLS